MPTAPAATEAAPPDLPGRLRHYREQSGLTRDEVAVRLGRGWHALSAWETGARAPRLHQLRDLARIYGVPVVGLLPDTDHQVAP